MSINKRFVDKETILIATTSLTRLLNADALIVKDEWSQAFITEYTKLITKLNKKYHGTDGLDA